MQLFKHGEPVENVWTFVDETDAIPATGNVTVTLARLRAEAEQILSRNVQIGVRLAPEDDPADLAPYLDRISLVEISFPKFTDGRGYSQAQLIRRRYGYTGELRAVGHVLRDQILYMNRSGFDAFETSRADLPGIREALNEYSAFYQPAAGTAKSVFELRHQDA